MSESYGALKTAVVDFHKGKVSKYIKLSTIIFVHSHLYSQNDYRPGNFIIEPAPERAWIKGAKKITTCVNLALVAKFLYYTNYELSGVLK